MPNHSYRFAHGWHRQFIAIAFVSCWFLSCAYAQTNVLTFHNDNTRAGVNATETRLTPANVNPSTFGKLNNFMVDGKVDAQPLYVAGLPFPGGGVHNVVYVATEHDSVYAFNADTGDQLWKVSMLKNGETTSDPRNCEQVLPEIGITATPVIDLSAGPHGSIYLVAMSKDGAGNYYQRLHALDLATGAEQPNSPVDVQATYPGTGRNSSNGNVIFDPKQYKERAALLLLNGVVYTSWTSHCDIQPYTGWLIGYDKNSLAQTSVYNFAPNGGEASIWNSGAGPAADQDGYIYIQLANGTFDETLDSAGFPSRGNYGNAFVKLSTANNQLQVVDYWTMYNSNYESQIDQDLGSGGLMLLPDVTDATGQVKHLGIGGGKDGNIYMFDRDHMGKFNPADNSNLYQELTGALAAGVFSTPTVFNGNIYFGAISDNIKAFSLAQGRLLVSPSSSTPNRFTYPGATPSISANGTADAILWAVENSSNAVLHAYDATNLANELYNSNQASNGRDQFGSGNKFIVPTIADGKVFVGTQNSVAVFGLLNSTVNQMATTVSLAASAPVANTGSPINFAASVASNAGIASGTVTFNDGPTPVATVPLDPAGNVTFSTAALAVGTHTITALYSGAATFAGSSSAPVTITIIPASPPGTSFTASAVTVPPGVAVGASTLTWNAPTAATIQIHVNTPDGPLFTQSGPTGTVDTGPWVTDGMTFFLQDVSAGKALTADNTLAVAMAHVSATPLQGSLTINPNPAVGPGGLATVTLSWNTSSSNDVEIRVNAPDGPLFSRSGPTGSQVTGPWVTNGMMFFLQDVSRGEILTPAYTIATATAQVTPQ